MHSGRPQHRRLALTRDPATIRVSWDSAQSDGAFGEGSADSHRVRWGAAPDALASETQATTSTYSASDLCGSPGKV